MGGVLYLCAFVLRGIGDGMFGGKTNGTGFGSE